MCRTKFPSQESMVIDLLQFLNQHNGKINVRKQKPDLLKFLASKHSVTPAEAAETAETPKGKEYNRWDKHVCWVRKKAMRDGMLDGSVRNQWELTEKGVERVNEYERKIKKLLGLD